MTPARLQHVAAAYERIKAAGQAEEVRRLLKLARNEFAARPSHGAAGQATARALSNWLDLPLADCQAAAEAVIAPAWSEVAAAVIVEFADSIGEAGR